MLKFIEMKQRFMLLLASLCWGLAALAQTEFRHLSLAEALTLAQQEQKPVFVDFYTDWCGPCKMMMREVFPQKDLGHYLNSRFICIKLNAEKEGKDAARQYGVNAYPTLMVIAPDGKEVMKRVGMADAGNLMAEIERAINPDMSPRRMAERYAAGERTAALIQGYAAYLSDEPGVDRRQARANAQRMVFDYFESLSTEQRLAPEHTFVYTDYLSRLTDAPARFMVGHAAEFPAQTRPVVDSLVARIHKDEAFYYLLLMIPYETEGYEAFKQSVDKLHLNREGWYTPFFELIETQVGGNLENYMGVCERVYDLLDEEQRLNLIAAQASVMRKAPRTIKQRAARFIRARLEHMTLSQLGNVVYPLAILEGPDA